MKSTFSIIFYLKRQVVKKDGTVPVMENGKCDIQLSTLYKIFQGLGKRVSVTIL